MQVETKDINSLTIDPANARQHDEAQIATIRASLEEFGQQKPIVVDKEGKVVAGNGTLQAAQEIGWQEIQVVTTELDGSKQVAFAIADNRTAELATWDEKALAEALEGLADLSFDLAETTGFGEAEMRRLWERTEQIDIGEPPDWANTTVDDVEAGVHKIMLTFTTEEYERFTEAVARYKEEEGISETTGAVIRAMEKATGHAIA